jgi:hypothetical protein
MRVIIKAIVTVRRNGPTPKHASQHVPAAFPSGDASRSIALPRRKLASPDAPPFGPYVLSPVPHGIRISANFPKILSRPLSIPTISYRAFPSVRCATCPAPQSGSAKQRPRAVQRDTAASPAGRSDTKWALDRATIPSGYVVFPKTLARLVFAHNDAQFLSIRKTLEANMPLHNLYPPGRVLWAVRDSDLSYAAPPPAERRYSPMEALRAHREEDGVRLFEVLDVEKVFSQIIFSRDMVRYESHASVCDPNGNTDMDAFA